MPFFPGQRLTAAALAEIFREARSAHIGAAGFLAVDNGAEQVVRNPRRALPARAVAAAAATACQWKTRATWDAESKTATVTVGAGVVAWGGGAWAVNPGGELGRLSEGEKRFVLWITSSAPRPLKFDPRWPKGEGAPGCGCSDCDCHAATGDPNAGWESAPAGSLVMVEDGQTPSGDAELTDIWLIASVDVAEGGSVTVVQWQRDTIAARAIVGAEPVDPDDGEEDDDAPPCGNPLNEEEGGGGVEENPLDEDGGTGGGDAADIDAGADPTPKHREDSDGKGGKADQTDENPLDSTGDGGYSPTCKDDSSQDL